MSVCTSRRRAFTLIEMLVVMGIIALLMGILFPVLAKVKDVARRTRARTEVKQLALAWNSYLNDYRTWFPSPGGGVGLAASIRMMDAATVKILAGVDIANNSRSVMFYEFPSNTNSFFDPWSKEYQVALDPNYDNSVDASPPAWPAGPGIVPRNVAVWSKGKNNGLAGTLDVNTDDIKSW